MRSSTGASHKVKEIIENKLETNMHVSKLLCNPRGIFRLPGNPER